MDALMTNLINARAWYPEPSAYKNTATGQSLLANDIDGASYSVIHTRLIKVLMHYQIPNHLVGYIADFNSQRTIQMSYDGETEEP